MNDTSMRPDASAVVGSADRRQSQMLSFDLNAELEGCRQEKTWQSGRSSKMLVKHPDVRVILMALKSGARLNEHKNAGRILVHMLAGHIRMQVQGKVFDLPAGHMLALDRDVIHDVEAVMDSAFVLTIASPQGKGAS